MSSYNPFMRLITCISGALLLTGVAGQSNRTIPALAQVIDQRSFNVLHNASTITDGTSQFIPPGTTRDSLSAKPFHIYDDEFYAIIGPSPTLTLLNRTGSNPRFHEAPVWYPETDEFFFAQNAGARAAGTGLNRSAVIQKIDLSQITPNITALRSAAGLINVEYVNPSPNIINPNGGTNYRGRILFVGEGQGPNIAPAIYRMHPTSPYNTTILLDNFFGRQFNSINDIAIHPTTNEIYFTDTTYGYVQEFRPPPGLPKQVYRFNPETGAVTVVADGFNMPNGIAFSPDRRHLYVTDTGLIQGHMGLNTSFPSTIYQYQVLEDGTLGNRRTFAFVSPGVPDGIHFDRNGNLYAGCGDGVQVYNKSGKLIGKIHVGGTSANFQFAGKGRMVILAETELYFATLAAEGAWPEASAPSN